MITLNPPAFRPSFATETVWDVGLAGTGEAGEGRKLTIGREGDWLPEHLLLLAAESCFMSTFLALTADAGMTVLGYVSNGRLHIPEDPSQSPSIVVTPCVVCSDQDRSSVLRLAEQAKRESVVARALGGRFLLELAVRAIPDDVLEGAEAAHDAPQHAG